MGHGEGHREYGVQDLVVVHGARTRAWQQFRDCGWPGPPFSNVFLSLCRCPKLQRTKELVDVVRKIAQKSVHVGLTNRTISKAPGR